jgi:hypothetical protein
MSESANETADASVADDFAVNNSQDETSQDEEVSAAGTSKDTRGNDNIAEDLLEESYEVYANLTTRATNLRALRSLWSSRVSRVQSSRHCEVTGVLGLCQVMLGDDQQVQ